jgi:protein ImuB
MPVAEATAIDRHLLVHPEDLEGDVRALEQLAQWAERFSPIVGLEEGSAPQSLLLDISGCADCFHGEDQLLQRALRELTREGWTARLAIAAMAGAAWGLAHFARTPCLAGPEETESLLRPLPVQALRLPDETIDRLVSLGIERIEQLMTLPRASIPARFGPAVLQRLDQALGRQPEVIVPHRFLAEARAVYSFPYATDRFEEFMYAVEQLTHRIHESLRNRQLGAREVECCLFHEAAPPLRIAVGLFRVSRSPQHLGMLLRTRLEQVRIAEPVCAVGLRVSAAEPLIDCQSEFFETEQLGSAEGLSALVDRLSSRLGPKAVTRPTLVPDPQPEYAFRFEPLIQTGVGSPAPRVEKRTGTKARKRLESGPRLEPFESRLFVQRPLRVWPTPEPIQTMAVVPDGPPLKFHRRGREYRVRRSWGPERIQTGWWRGQDVQRDYYVVETHMGNRFWIFNRHEDGRWFLQGCFD